MIGDVAAMKEQREPGKYVPQVGDGAVKMSGYLVGPPSRRARPTRNGPGPEQAATADRRGVTEPTDRLRRPFSATTRVIAAQRDHWDIIAYTKGLQR